MNPTLQHSPAPWRFCIDGEMDNDCNIPKVNAPLNFMARGYCNNPSIIDANGETVAGCSEYNVFKSRNQHSNVALMLSAPELLAALAGCADALREAGKDFAQANKLAARPNLYELHEQAARAAIARATGGNAL